MRSVVVALSLVLVAHQSSAGQTPAEAPTPQAVSGLLLVQPFSLEQGYRFDWLAERPVVAKGTLVVLEVDPRLVAPRNAPQPVLYAGDTTVQRLNEGHESGRVVGIIPGEVDLAASPLWFGAPGLPERATRQSIRAERAAAEQAGIRPFAAEVIARATRAPIAAADLASLLRDHVAEVVLELSPQERALAQSWAAAPPQEAPVGVADLLVAQPFALAEGFRFDWSAERPLVTQGLLVVVQVDPELVAPTNAPERVLYAGRSVVQRLNQGQESGRVVGLIPAEIDLAAEPLWFGGADLPERVGAQHVRAARALADRAGIRPIDAARVQAASRPAVEAANLFALLRDHAAELVLEHSPQEKALADSWRLPVARKRD
jgi:hypothetical protein